MFCNLNECYLIPSEYVKQQPKQSQTKIIRYAEI